MFICEIWLFDWYFPQFCKSDMSKYGYLEVFQRVPSTSRKRELTVYTYNKSIFCFQKEPPKVDKKDGKGQPTPPVSQQGHRLSPRVQVSIVAPNTM